MVSNEEIKRRLEAKRKGVILPDDRETESNTVFCPKCGAENGEQSNFCISCGNGLIQKHEEEKEERSETIQTPTNPMIGVSFYESMPGRVSLGNNASYIKGILEIADNEIIIHKKSYWRGKNRGTKHIRYDKITSIDYDEGKLLALPSIQLYLSSVEYSFRSADKRLKSFYDMIREKIDEVNIQEKTNSTFSVMDELKKLAELRDMGVVTEEEFKLKKKQLLEL